MATNYVESNLLAGEQLIYKAHLHPIIFALPIALAAVGISVLIGASKVPAAGVILLVLAAVMTIPPYIAVKTSEFAVTNRRVLIKVGWLHRQSLELLLQKVESISVDQSLMGRMLNFGTIGVRGTGGSRERFPNIAQPLEFRRQVQVLTVDKEAVVAGPIQRTATLPPSQGALPTEETKKCPHCLSDIPAAATVCRFCARDVVTPA
jgi:uncharacterized membrane protein YdbT with pleckstrin-like domain